MLNDWRSVDVGVESISQWMGMGMEMVVSAMREFMNANRLVRCWLGRNLIPWQSVRRCAAVQPHDTLAYQVSDISTSSGHSEESILRSQRRDRRGRTDEWSG